MESKKTTQHSETMIDDLRDRYKALSHQESFYQCQDCFTTSREGVARKQAVDETCRYTMANWCHQVLDYCNASEETASVALSYADRFVSSKQGSFVLNDKKWFQLAVMCSLQLAIKVQESSRLESHTLSELSRGMFSVEDITLMEKALLSGLSWRLCPATPYVFLELFLDLLPPSISSCTIVSLMKISKRQIHMASSHFSFSLQKSSAVAFAALLNSMEEIRCSTEDEEALRYHAGLVGFKCLDKTCLSLRRELNALINPPSLIPKKSASCSKSSKNCTQTKGPLSPVCVRQACQ